MSNIKLTIDLNDREFIEFMHYTFNKNIKIQASDEKLYYKKITNNIISGENQINSRLISGLYNFLSKHDHNELNLNTFKDEILRKILNSEKISNDDKINWIIKFNSLLSNKDN
jgi:hypothetical protein